jgi:hypothetical protein
MVFLLVDTIFYQLPPILAAKKHPDLIMKLKIETHSNKNGQQVIEVDGRYLTTCDVDRLTYEISLIVERVKRGANIFDQN